MKPTHICVHVLPPCDHTEHYAWQASSQETLKRNHDPKPTPILNLKVGGPQVDILPKFWPIFGFL